MIKFLFGVVITILVIVFAEPIQSMMVSSGVRDSLVVWLQSWN